MEISVLRYLVLVMAFSLVPIPLRRAIKDAMRLVGGVLESDCSSKMSGVRGENRIMHFLFA